MKSKKETSSKVEILIAEDSPTQAARLAHLLEERGYAVTTAANGREALALLERRKPALVISDVLMPELDGYGLCKAIKTDEKLKDVPVMLVTTLSDPQDVIRGLECGADNFIRKPYDGRYLLSRIDYLLMNLELRKNQKMQMGVEIDLGGQRHFISSERQQILDLLISTYEQAVEINSELKQREQELAHSNQVLNGLYRIADALNHAASEWQVLEMALERALELPGIQAGWIVLREGESGFRLAAARNLPPALQAAGAMEGDCTCRRRLISGDLDHVTNIMECERLGTATGDTHGLRYHASVPLWLGDRTLGVMNLVGPEKGLFNEDELKILYSVGNQVAVALERARLHEHLEQLVEERTAALTVEIAERQRTEEEIRTLNADLERRVAERTQQVEEANRAKSDFLANMSHELRTPLNSIIGCSEMLKDGVLGELDAKQRGFVADIFDAGSHLLSLINDILDLSKVEAGMLRLEADAVDVAALLKASTLVVREKALAHRIRLDTQLDPALGTMLADERKLKQIVYNLLSNAVKFTPEGGAVTLSARRCARAEVALDEALPGRLIALPPGEDGEFLAITVEDSGVGIAEEHLPKLFEPFVQLDSSVSRRQAGTGLGLSLVRRLAELHGGTVGVASRPGVGSRFCVWLPWRAAAPAAPVAPAAQEGRTLPGSMAPSTPEARAPGAPALPLALVIEDDDRAADLIAAQLHAEGFAVMRAATAEEGLVRAAKRRPQLITLDIFLPAMDGWEFMRRLKADPRLADTPVVIISVSEDLERGIALGARRVLQKPFAPEELVAALAGLIEARPGGTPALVLVVDDNVKAVGLLATLLEAEGYRVLRAYGGAEAIEAARSTRPDLVILDLMMPEGSGFEVVHALRGSEQTARIQILVLTAKDLSAEDHARLNGAVSAIIKKSSLSRGELLAELRRALPQRGGD